MKLKYYITTFTIQQFNIAIEELKQLNKDAYEWLKTIPLQHWSMSYFTRKSYITTFFNFVDGMNMKRILTNLMAYSTL